MEVIRADRDGIEFYTIQETGESGMSQSGLALLVGVDRTTLRDLELTLGARSPSELLKPFVGKDLTLGVIELTMQGKSLGNLKIYSASYCAAVIQHYAFHGPDHAKPMAQYALSKFLERGINDWIQEITGYKQQSQFTQIHTDVYIQRIEHMRDHQVNDDLWMIFREGSELLLRLEKEWQVPINDYDLLDGSIGIRWSNYRIVDWNSSETLKKHSNHK